MAKDVASYAISVMTRDRVGIIADVSSAIYALGGNLEAMSQTIVGGWFTMISRATFPATVTGPGIKEAIEAAGDYQVLVSPCLDSDAPTTITGEPFVATVVGDDKPGIVRGLTGLLASRDINIEDVWNEVHGGRFIVILALRVPATLDPNELRYELQQRAAELGVTAQLQHQDIFTATNSLSVHTKR